MAQTQQITISQDQYAPIGQKNGGWRWMVLGMVILGLGVLSAKVHLDHGQRFFHAYLVNYAFFLSIALGGLFFVILHHLVRAGWSTTVRRLAEMTAAGLPLLALLALPIVMPMLLGNDTLYIWVNKQLMQDDPLLHKKLPYLNMPFFAVRLTVYFTFWSLTARYFFKRSVQQDQTGTLRKTAHMQALSAPAMILFGLTLTFAAFDLLMSLAPSWFSTIYGVYYFAGSFMSFLCVLVLVVQTLQARGRLTACVTGEHFHDMGKLMFAFVFFWGYIAFSQYMLIWYANIPEETQWFLLREQSDYAYIGIILIFGHFIVPFIGLLSRHVKRHRQALWFFAVYLLAMHWLDMYWNVMPSMLQQHQPQHAAAHLQAHPVSQGSSKASDHRSWDAQSGLRSDAKTGSETRLQHKPAQHGKHIQHKSTAQDAQQHARSPHNHSAHPVVFGLPELACLIGLFLVMMGGFINRLASYPLLAYRDPRLSESLSYHNL